MAIWCTELQKLNSIQNISIRDVIRRPFQTMKKAITIFLLLIGGFQFTSYNSATNAFKGRKGIEFFKGTWSEALQKAAEENKYIFVDVYATWCGPCKQLKKTFKDEEVGNYYNKNFINVAIDGETPEGRKFLYKYKIDSYPTLLIVDSNGNVKTKSIGFLKPYILINFGRRIVPLN